MGIDADRPRFFAKVHTNGETLGMMKFCDEGNLFISQGASIPAKEIDELIDWIIDHRNDHKETDKKGG